MRGKLGAVEVRGGELLVAAEAHDALYSFDMRARAAALEIGLPLLPEGEILFVNLDPRAVHRRRVLRPHDVAARRARRRRPGPRVPRARAPRALPRPRLLEALVAAHRRRGALIALDDLSGGADVAAPTSRRSSPTSPRSTSA